MKQTHKRTLTLTVSIALSALLLVGLFAACGASGSAAPESSGYLSFDASGMLQKAAAESQLRDGDYSNVYVTNMASVMGGGEVERGRFVIARANVTIQTKAYDAFTAALKAGLKAMGGYTDAYNEWNFDSDRRADITARVPSEKLDAFLDSLEQNGTIMSRSVTTNDVTDEMIETGSKKEALIAEEKALLAILEKATTVEDIIRVQDRLSNVRADLESYSRRLQSLQNQVNYSTVSISVSEVNRITTPTQRFGVLASSNFLASLRDVGSGLRNFALWFISAIPWLVLLAVPAALLVWIVRRVRKNRKAKKAGM
ncbi:MAG: DUF4349 domain-containing protein [Oscillospiraceae bacterium]|nr:DUF4349 domain-containing protein [Oscillospiraceae bacterium]